MKQNMFKRKQVMHKGILPRLIVAMLALTMMPGFSLSFCYALVDDSAAAKNNKQQEALLISGSADHRENPTYVADQVIVKIKKQSPCAEVLDELFKRAQTMESITDNKALDIFIKRFNVTRIDKVFPASTKYHTIPKGQDITYEMAVAARDQEINAEEAEIKEIVARKKELSVQSNDKDDAVKRDVPYLSSIYVMTLGNGAGDPLHACDALRQLPEVAYAEPNYMIKAHFEPNDRYYPTDGAWEQDYDDLYALKEDRLDCEHAWDGTFGEGVVVAVIDSGVDYTHEDLAPNIWINEDEELNGEDTDNNGVVDDIRGYDFSSNNNDPMDEHGHGTHCAGTIAAVGNNERGIIGVAPGATIMAVRGLDERGAGTSNNLANCIRYAARNDAHVLNNSWGPDERNYSNQTVEVAIDYAYAANCVVVFSAGNEDDDVQHYSPANYAKTIAVAATDYNDERAEFSQYGNLIDLSAPGVEILSLRADETDMYERVDGYRAGARFVPAFEENAHYYRASGTSMAAPHAAGLAALLFSRNRYFSNEDIRAIMRESTDDQGQEGFDIYFGAGRINANQALEMAPPCLARIDSPSVNEGYFDDMLEIIGSAAGDDFQNYTLAYTDDLDEGEWINIGDVQEEMVVRDVLGYWDISDLRGDFFLRVQVTDIHGDTFSDVKGPISVRRPNLIRTVADLQNIRDDLDAIYHVAANFDATDGAQLNDGRGFEPIGSDDEPFTGIFNGMGHVISNLTIDKSHEDDEDAEDHVGLFGCIDRATIENIGLENVLVRGNSRVGGLIGRNKYDCTISNCWVTGRVEGNRYVGGIVGASRQSRLYGCYTTAQVTGNSVDVGGLIGNSYHCRIYDCYASNGCVSGSNNVGGLIGNNASVVINTYATGAIESERGHVGGLIGRNRVDEEYYSNNIWDKETTGQAYGLEREDELEYDDIVGYDTQTLWEEDTYPHYGEEGGDGDGWDFEQVWFMPREGFDYPHLRIEEDLYVQDDEVVTQELELFEGWNLISFNVNVNGMDIRDVLAPLAEDGVLIQVKDGRGRYWRPERNFSNMDPLSIGEAYLVRVAEDVTLTVEAPAIEYPVTITLQSGWNFTGYPSQEEHQIAGEDGILQELIADGKINLIKREDGRFCSPANNFYGFRTLEPGEGYQIKINGNEEVSFEITE